MLRKMKRLAALLLAALLLTSAGLADALPEEEPVVVEAAPEDYADAPEPEAELAPEFEVEEAPAEGEVYPGADAAGQDTYAAEPGAAEEETYAAEAGDAPETDALPEEEVVLDAADETVTEAEAEPEAEAVAAEDDLTAESPEAEDAEGDPETAESAPEDPEEPEIALEEAFEEPVEEVLEDAETLAMPEVAEEEATPEEGAIPIDEEHFPDYYFRDCVKQYDKDGSGALSEAELAAVTRLDLSPHSVDFDIHSLNGIEYFTSVEWLECGNNSLNGSLDLRAFKNLTRLDCFCCGLTSLNVSGCTRLTELDCSSNRLTSLNVSTCTNLKRLECSSNKLKLLDISGCTKLKTVAHAKYLRGYAEYSYDYVVWGGCGFRSGNTYISCGSAAYDSVPDLTILTGETALYVRSLTKSGSCVLGLKETLVLDLDWEEISSIKNSNKVVATCSKYVDDEGYEFIKVVPKAGGTTTLTIKLKNGKKLTYKIQVPGGNKPVGVSLNKSGTAPLYTYQTLQLKAYFKPASTKSALTWKSSNKAVAKVNASGLVTPVKAGTATITVTTANKLKASVKVEVLDPNMPSRVALNKSAAKLYIGEQGNQQTLVAACSFAKPEYVTEEPVLTWTSSSSKIVKVDAEGVITAVKPGTATITVTTPNNKKATCKVTVFDPNAPTKVKLNKSSAALYPGTKAKTQTLVATCTFPKAEYVTSEPILTWKSSNKKVVTVNSAGVITAVSLGTATITVTTPNNKKATCKVTVRSRNAVRSVTLDRRTLTLYTSRGYKTCYLYESVNYYRKDLVTKEAKVTWKSSNTRVATVDKYGKVILKGKGTATITATAGGKKATCKVTVRGNKYTGPIKADNYELRRYNGNVVLMIKSAELLGNGKVTVEAYVVNATDDTVVGIKNAIFYLELYREWGDDYDDNEYLTLVNYKKAPAASVNVKPHSIGTVRFTLPEYQPSKKKTLLSKFNKFDAADYGEFSYSGTAIMNNRYGSYNMYLAEAW